MTNTETVTKNEVSLNLEKQKIKILLGIKSTLTVIAILSFISTIILFLMATHTLSIMVY